MSKTFCAEHDPKLTPDTASIETTGESEVSQELQIGQLAIQCHPKGLDTPGDFLFEEGHPSAREPLTPVFPGLVELYRHLRENGWRHPVGDEAPGYRYDGMLYVRPLKETSECK